MNIKNLAARATRKFALKLVEVRPLDVVSGMVTCGNHSVRDIPDFTTVVRSDDGTRDVEVMGNREFLYHGSVIAVAHDNARVLTVTSAGYGQMSTSAAIRQYASHFSGLGYKIVVAS